MLLTRSVILGGILLLRSGGCGWVGVGGSGAEKSRLKLTSAKVEVELEAELGNYIAVQVYTVVQLFPSFVLSRH